MDTHALKVLEFELIRKHLADQCACSLGREKALDLIPSDHLRHVQTLLDQTTECRKLIEVKGSLPLGGVTDIRPLIRQSEIGGILDPRQLLDVYNAVSASRNLKAFIVRSAVEAPLMLELAGGLGQFASLESEVLSSISPSGMVMDSASPDLASLRSRKKSAAHRMQDRLNSILSGASRAYLQDAVIVQRGDRYCVPVKADHRGAFGGIVHDTSASGATLFMEPQAVVDLGNEIRELTIKEDHEVVRILTRLTRSVQRVSEPLTVTIAVLAEVDFISARAKLSQEHRATPPTINKDGIVRLRGARHPLLDPDLVVPIDIELGTTESKVVLITGPNTGGKTVSLKTVGLFALMCQSGLHVPAIHAELNVFYDVFADIGDEQSLQQSLSTFSGHISNIVAILKSIRTNSLVLLDELGAGTDPGEGASLATALLNKMRETDARVIATTHYGELKSYAFLTPGVQNASVEFNIGTLSPTYRLLQGVPGASNAFAIATRLGMPDDIIADARVALSGSDETVDLIRNLEENQRQAVTDAREAERNRIEAQILKRRYQDQLESLEALRRDERQKMDEEARSIMKRAQARLDNTLSELRKASSEGQHTERARQKIKSIGDDLQNALQRRTARPTLTQQPTVPLDGPLSKGDVVELLTLGMNGEVLEDQRDMSADAVVSVQVGAIRVTVPASSLRLLKRVESEPHAERIPEPSINERPRAEIQPSISMQKAMDITPQISLLGQRADEAVQNVERYLDDAYAAGLTRVRVVHGKGTGALRRAVHQLLTGHPLAMEFATADAEEGGAGATIVVLKDS